MFNRDSIPYGLLLGFGVPLLAFSLLMGIFTVLANTGAASDEAFRPMFTQRTSAIVAIGINAILINQFFKRRQTNSMRGIVIATFVLVILWLWQFGRYVL